LDFFQGIEGATPETFTALQKSAATIAQALTGGIAVGEIKAEEPAPGKRKRQKREVDPNAPRKPMTAYFRYAAQARQQIRKEREGASLEPLSNSEVTTEIARRWQTLSDDDKKPFQEEYYKAFTDYMEAKEAYKKKKDGIVDAEAEEEQEEEPAPEPVVSHKKHKADKEKPATPVKEKEPEESPKKKKEKKERKKKRKSEAGSE
jgi:hypothetical protein